MAEQLQCVGLPISDRPKLKAVDVDWDATFPASTALAGQRQNTIVWRFYEFKGLQCQVVPRAPHLLPELNERVWTPQILRKVRHRPLVVPAELEMRIAKIRDGFPAQLATHEGIEDVKSLADELDVLLRHRLPRQPGGFEGLGAIPVAGRDLRNLALAQCPDGERPHLGLDAAAATPSGHPTGHKDIVARIDELPRARFERCPTFRPPARASTETPRGRDGRPG